MSPLVMMAVVVHM